MTRAGAAFALAASQPSDNEVRDFDAFNFGSAVIGSVPMKPWAESACYIKGSEQMVAVR
jgi:hypothetical protein